jgi:transcriptional regulator with XRE-family HTH domain
MPAAGIPLFSRPLHPGRGRGGSRPADNPSVDGVGGPMTPQAIKKLREYLHLTQEAFASILGVSFATVNRWENGKSVPTGDYARVLQTLQRLTAYDAPGPAIDWKRVGALSAMAAVAGFSPLLTLGAALAPVLIAHLPSWADVPLGEVATEGPRARRQGKAAMGRTRIPLGNVWAKTAGRRVRTRATTRADTPRTGL